jgi:hypothetical protein
MDAVSLKGYLAIAATILSVALATSPVHAVTQDEYENIVPERPGNDEAHVRATGGALKIAMNTEYVRAIRMGENQRAICLHDHFVPNERRFRPVGRRSACRLVGQQHGANMDRGFIWT